jgi:hypothetical protein
MASDDGEPASSTVPHWTQNLLPTGMSALQFGQTIPHLCLSPRTGKEIAD